MGGTKGWRAHDPTQRAYVMNGTDLCEHGESQRQRNARTRLLCDAERCAFERALGNVARVCRAATSDERSGFVLERHTLLGKARSTQGSAFAC